MKVAVIGVGYWGKKHVDEYIQLGYDVIICDNHEKNIVECKEKFKTVEVKNFEAILNDNEIICVSICTPNETHFEIASECLDCKKHVFLEKPIATNLKDANKLIEISEKNNLILQIGHLYRFNNSILKAKEIIKNKKLGTVHSVYFSWNNFEPIFNDRGIILDLGIHPIDIIDYIFDGKYENIKCRGWGIRQNNPEFAILNYKLSTSDKQTIFINIELNWLNPIRKREMIIIGDENTLKVQCVDQKISLIDNSSKNEETVSVLLNNTIRDELEFFISSCKKNKAISSPYPNATIAKSILEVVLAAEIENSDKK